jgi:Protein of unknown function (DUF4238)
MNVHVRDQHTVSRVLLRRFADERTSQLAILDLATGTTRQRGSRGFGYEQDFIRHNTMAAEQLWKKVEDKLPSAFAAIDSGAAVLANDEAEIVKACVALHWARSGAMSAAHSRIYNDVLGDHLQRLAYQPEILNLVFLQNTGLHAAGPQARLWALDLLSEGLPSVQNGQFFSQRVPLYYRWAVDRFRTMNLELLDSPPGWEFCISDTPVLTLREGQPGTGPHQGVALGDATVIAMPVGPTTAVALHGAVDRRVEATVEVMRALNRYQIAAARRRVVYRPNSPVGPILKSWLDDTAAA